VVNTLVEQGGVERRRIGRRSSCARFQASLMQSRMRVLVQPRVGALVLCAFVLRAVPAGDSCAARGRLFHVSAVAAVSPNQSLQPTRLPARFSKQSLSVAWLIS
jgi:hypothetical protein